MIELASDAVIACKFGGTSVADAGQVRQIVSIINADPRRKYVVVSAPGKRFAADKKITDLLYLWHHTVSEGVDASAIFNLIRHRYEQIAEDLEVNGVGEWLDEVEAQVNQGASKEWVASRGEYLQARLVAAYMGSRFVDATECIRFTNEGKLDTASYEITARAVEGDDLVIIPGFYGQDPRGRVRTFSRGGSDITGAIVARAVNAGAYENWTDVDGLLMADPRIVPDPLPIRTVTYNELRELSYMGANVLHDEAVFPVRETGIPINIRNTNAPEKPGSWIVDSRPDDGYSIVGVAGKKGFTTIYVEKTLMNAERGFGRKFLQILENHGISYEHSPSGIDSMSVIMREEELANQEQSVLDELRRALQPDRVELLGGLALIATVGQGMSHRIGVASRLFTALAEAGVNIRMIDQGASEINIITGVAEEDYERALQAIYNMFVAD